MKPATLRRRRSRAKAREFRLRQQQLQREGRKQESLQRRHERFKQTRIIQIEAAARAFEEEWLSSRQS